MLIWKSTEQNLDGINIFFTVKLKWILLLTINQKKYLIKTNIIKYKIIEPLAYK